jgi:phosphoribosyl 1,2-cyclic phosphodiesterase
LSFGFASLGSGSQGNATLVSDGRTHILVDCGFGLRDLERRLARHGLEASQLAAVFVTHEHGDHVAGVGALARRHGTPVWMTHGTWLAAAPVLGEIPVLEFVQGEAPVAIDGLEVLPLTVPHDAREPRQFIIGNGAASLGVVTDLGSSTPHLIRALGRCDALLLEFNHDQTLLEQSSYPEFLKARILGAWGHLSNTQAAELLASLPVQRLRAFVAAHLSEKNNRPGLVRKLAAQALGCSDAEVTVADQELGSAWMQVAL